MPTKTFFIRAVSAAGMSAKLYYAFRVGWNLMSIQISDGMWSQSYNLELVQGSFSMSVGNVPGQYAQILREATPLGFSFNLAGPWHLFELRQARTVNDFHPHTTAFFVAGKAKLFEGISILNDSTGPDARPIPMSWGASALTLQNPFARLDPFKLGWGINLLSPKGASAGFSIGYGVLRRNFREPLNIGPRWTSQSHLIRGGEPGSGSQDPL